jgi:hypothetical protein
MRRSPWATLAVLALAQFIVVLDVTIVNVALPHIQADLHFSADSLQWVINAYTLLFGGFLLLGGRMADLLGPRRVFMAGLLLFGVTSLLAGLSNSPEFLIGARAVQGLGGALLSPAALGDPDDDVRARPRAEHRHGGLGRSRRSRWDARCGGRRRTGRFTQLAVGVLRQRADRDRTGRSDPGVRSRRTALDWTSYLRHFGRSAGDLGVSWRLCTAWCGRSPRDGDPLRLSAY